MVFVEYLVRQVSALAPESFRNGTAFGDVGGFGIVFSGCDAENGKKHVDGGQVCRFVDAHTHIAVLEVAQVHFLAQGDGAHLLRRYIVGQCEAERVEVPGVHLPVS